MKKAYFVFMCFFLFAGLSLTQADLLQPPKGEHYDLNFVTEAMFTENFDGGLSNWQQISGTWNIVQEGANNICSIQGGSYVGGYITTVGSEYWTDYSLEFDVKKYSGSYFNVVFRYADQGNHYLLEPSSDTVHIALFKKVGGGGYQELTSPRPLQNTVVGQWYHYRILVQGPTIKVYVDNVLKIDVTDFDLPKGKIGLGSWPGSIAYFDNITVLKPNEVLVAFNGTVPGLMYVAGDSFEILDHDAGVIDGDCAVLQLPLYAIYDVYCSARGTPGGEIYWGCNHIRESVPAGKPVWHQHEPDNFCLCNYGTPLGPYAVKTSNNAALLALRWYPQN